MNVTQYQEDLIQGYQILTADLPPHYAQLINIFVFSILIALYAGFTWKFSRFLAKRDLLDINLSQYNTAEHPATKKTYAVLLYFAEYLIILPFVIFFWFAVFSIIILVASQTESAAQVLVLSAAIVASTRIISYYNEELSQDIAKLLPLTLLAVLIFTPGFFSFSNILLRLFEIPSLTTDILYFLIFIIVLELLLRIVTLMFDKTPKEPIVG